MNDRTDLALVENPELSFQYDVKQKAVALLFSLPIIGLVLFVQTYATVGNAPVPVRLVTILGGSLVLLLFGYPCLHTLTYGFEVNDHVLIRKGFLRTQTVRWDDVQNWSIEERVSQRVRYFEPILKLQDGSTFSLGADVWCTSPGTVEARQQLIKIVQRTIPNKPIEIQTR